MATLTAATRPNVYRITGDLDEEGDSVLYKFRSGKTGPTTVRISIMGTFTGTVDVRACDPGTASGNENNQYKVLAQYTTPESVVFEMGGSMDIYLYASAWTDGSARCSIGK